VGWKVSHTVVAFPRAEGAASRGQDGRAVVRCTSTCGMSEVDVLQYPAWDSVFEPVGPSGSIRIPLRPDDDRHGVTVGLLPSCGEPVTVAVHSRSPCTMPWKTDDSPRIVATNRLPGVRKALWACRSARCAVVEHRDPVGSTSSSVG